MAFTTVRVHRSNFTQVPNDAMVKMLREKKTNAFGLYVFMASKPGTWEFQTSTIARQLNWSKSTVNRAMKDLEETGYMRWTIVKGSDGRFHHTNYEVFYEPQEKKDQPPEHDLIIPPDYYDLCEKPYTIDRVSYALAMQSDDDKEYLLKLQEFNKMAYYQILLHTITTLESHAAENPEGYAIAVIRTEIKRSKRTYGFLTKGRKNGSVQEKGKE